MTQSEFNYLYANLNGLVDLALLNVGASLEPIDEDFSVVQEGNDLLETSLENLDFDAMSGLDFYDPVDANEVIETASSANSEGQNSTDTNKQEQQKSKSEIDVNLDIEGFMQDLYEFEEPMVERMALLFEKLDHEKFNSLISAIPPEQARVTRKINDSEMRALLVQYLEDEQSILNLVVALREIDMA